MKKKIAAVFAACLVLMTLFPASVFTAAPVCTCAELCTAEAPNADCAVCAADYTACAAAETSAQVPVVPAAVAALLEQIAALPEQAALAGMNPEELNAAGEASVAAIEAIDALSDEDRAYFEENHAAEQTALYALFTAITEAQGNTAQTTAAPPLVTLWVGGKQVLNNSASTGTSSGTGWSYDGAGTLTLTGGTITGDAATGNLATDQYICPGIRAIGAQNRTSTFTINIPKGTTATIKSSSYSFGANAIRVDLGQLIITGGGTLELVVDIPVDATQSYDWSGIKATHGVTINDGTTVNINVKCTTAASIAARGLQAGQLTMNSGTLNVKVLTSNNNTGSIGGVSVQAATGADGILRFNGGEINVTTGKTSSTDSRYGIYTSGGLIMTGGLLKAQTYTDGGNAVSIGSGSTADLTQYNGNYKWRTGTISANGTNVTYTPYNYYTDATTNAYAHDNANEYVEIAAVPLAAVPDYMNQGLKDLWAGADYTVTVDGVATQYTADENGCITPGGATWRSWLGKKVTLQKVGNPPQPKSCCSPCQMSPSTSTQRR